MIFKIICETIRRSFLRCSRPLCSSQSTGGTFPARRSAAARKGPEVWLAPKNSSGPSGPNSVHVPAASLRTFPAASSVLSSKVTLRHLVKCSTHELTGKTRSVLIRRLDTRGCQMLLRKEVIQPHLPVRLPCYDFVPIAGPTFDGSLPQGVRPPASGVTNFRDLTGGVYKARERIHRSVADLRLLATPTS